MTRPAEPYRGQKRCPVCGAGLGARGEPVSVDWSIAVPQKPTLWQKMGLQSKTPQQQTMSFFACCPECAEAAKSSPSTHLAKVIVERGGM
ncbi:MAG: hypothetical protein K2R98_13585 [Gemmataceae bacterium]|nr:hypothetical protein [Gemmataceae bacterium]